MTESWRPALARVGRSTADGATDATDRELLLRFSGAADEAAFTTLVTRHGRLVFAACRRLLSTREDAEDACQATFLILARRAGAVRWERCVANWLYATARRVAAKARRAAVRRAGREAAAAVPQAGDPLDAITGRELLAILDEELGRLPGRYREPLVLCHFDGLSRDEAAVRLGLPPATVKTRLERGRRKLAAALAGRGVSAGVGLLALAATAAGRVPPSLTEAILAAARGSPTAAAAALAAGDGTRGTLGRIAAGAIASVVVVAAVWAAPSAPQPDRPPAVAGARPPAPAGADAKFPAAVETARRKAIRFLTERQSKDGTWATGPTLELTGMRGGETALVALALLEAGVPPTDPVVKKAVRHLDGLPPERTYVVGLHTRVLARADPKAHAARIQANADWLVARAIGLGTGRLGGWSYPGPDAGNVADGSNTHFAVFGLHAAATAGARLDPGIWTAVRDLYVRTRLPAGWKYHNSPLDPGTSRTMTAAALAGLAVADRHAAPTAAGRDAAAEGMRAFLEARAERPKSVGYLRLVTAELGRAIGTGTFRSGQHEVRWYQDGAEKLLDDQRPDGSWVAGDRGIDTSPILGTAYGLYFLGPPPGRGPGR